MEKVRERLDVRCEIVDIRLGKFDSPEQRTSLVTVDIPRKQRKILASAGKLKDFTLDGGAVFISPDYTPDELQIEQIVLKKRKEFAKPHAIDYISHDLITNNIDIGCII